MRSAFRASSVSGHPIAGETMQGERGFQGGRSAADVKTSVGSASVSAPATVSPSAASAGRAVENPQSDPQFARMAPPRASGLRRCMSLLIAGGGPAALEAALAVQRLAGDRLPVTLLSDRDEFVYRPVAVAEPFGFASAQRFSLRRLCEDRGFELKRGTVAAVDPDRHRVLLEGDGQVPYDVLLLALGARAEETIPERSPSAAPKTARGCGPRSSSSTRESRSASRSSPAPRRRGRCPCTSWR